MRAEELWKAYCEKENIDIDTPYSAWGFGDAPDQLADLVLKGIKTATASAYDLYFMEGEEEPLPQLGDYSVILDSKDEAICIIQTTKTTVVPFNEVSEEHAYKEGEGDRSLAYWRAVHEEFFTKEFEETKTEFNGQTRILCEEFQVVYDYTTTYQKISSPLWKKAIGTDANRGFGGLFLYYYNIKGIIDACFDDTFWHFNHNIVVRIEIAGIMQK